MADTQDPVNVSDSFSIFPSTFHSETTFESFTETQNIFTTANEEQQFTESLIYPTIFVFTLIILVTTVIGNVMVLVAMSKVKKIDNRDIYIINLSVTDLTNAVLPMPIIAVSIYKHGSYYIPEWLCLVSRVILHLLTTETILLICLISYDRLLLIYHGAAYQMQQPKRYVYCSVVWKVISCPYNLR